jgi:isopenicillin N synthase-like dioxygenase
VPDHILDVDLLAFEQSEGAPRRAVVDGVMQSLRTGFVYTRHDLSEDLVDTAYGMLNQFFSLPTETKADHVATGAHSRRGYTGLLVETAATSDVPDWKEMVSWGLDLELAHPLHRTYPNRYHPNVGFDRAVPGMDATLQRFHNDVADLQRRFLRIIAVGVGCHEDFFEAMLTDGETMSRAIHYPSMEDAPGTDHVWSAEHGDINLITALPRATARGLQVKTVEGWVDAAPPGGHVIINTGIMLEHLTNGVVPVGIHRVVADPVEPGERLSVVQFCHPTPWTVLSPVASTIMPDRPQRFAGITAAARLDQVLYETKMVDAGR